MYAYFLTMLVLVYGLKWFVIMTVSGLPPTSGGSMQCTKLCERTFIQMSACCMSISVEVTHVSTQMRYKLYTLVAPMSIRLFILEFTMYHSFLHYLKIPATGPTSHMGPPKADTRDDQGVESTGDHRTCSVMGPQLNTNRGVISTFFVLNHTQWVSRLLSGICLRPPMVRGSILYWWGLETHCRSCC